MYIVQVAIAGLCRDAGALFKCGVATQIGSAAGALVAFLVVTQVSIAISLKINIIRSKW